MIDIRKDNWNKTSQTLTNNITNIITNNITYRAWVALLYLRHPSSTSPDEDELDNGYYYTIGMDYNAPTTDNATTMGTKIAGSKVRRGREGREGG